MDNYFSMTIQGIAFQVLETVHIIATTKNFETIKGRFELLLERIETLREAKSNRLYLTDMNASVQTYKTMYYDRQLQDFELSAIFKPNNFDVINFYCGALANCIKRFVDEQTSEISALKSDNAKQKRKAKVIEKVRVAKEELQNKCSSASSYLVSLNQIAQTETTLN